MLPVRPSARPRRRRTLPLVVLLLLLPLLLPAPASAKDPRLVARSGNGAVWTAAAVQSTGAPVVTRLRMDRIALPLHLGARLYDADRTLISSTNVTLRTPEEGVLVQSQPTAGIGINVDELEETSGEGLRDVEGTLTLNPDGAVHVGRYTLVLWLASTDAGAWTWSVEGDGAQVLGATSGSRVFLATSRDFVRGLVGAAAGATLVGTSVQGRAQVGSSHRREAGGLLVGSYYPVLSSADTLSITTPRGERQCVPDCQFGDVTGAGTAGPGSYVFRLTGAGAGGAAGQSAGDVVAVGAEIVLPPGA